MNRINHVETFPQAGIRRGLFNAEEGLEVPDHRTPDLFTPGNPVKVKERRCLELEYGDTGHQAVNEGEAAMFDRILNGGEGRTDGGQETGYGNMLSKADFGHGTARWSNCFCVSFGTKFAIGTKMFQWGLRKIIFDGVKIPLFMGVKKLNGNYW